MKKILAMLLVLVMAASLFAGCASSGSNNTTGAGTTAPAGTEYKVAMITDYGDITDQSFNQTTYEACLAFAEANKVPFKYYKPTSNDTAGRVASVELAVADGHNVIVMPGYAFGATIVEVAADYPDVKFIALDVAAGDLLETAVANAGETYDYNPDNWELTKYVKMDNVYCAIYQEELCGYMAGYAAVKLGYTKLGFLGGMAVPAVIRYGYGFVQGADAAAAELGIAIEINYTYGGQFYGTPETTAKMEGWYENGTEVVFACGGGIYTSALEAAELYDGKVIGVDVDQYYISERIITSAMKQLQNVTEAVLEALNTGAWETYGGKVSNFSLAEGEYVGLPTAETSWKLATFTVDEYEALKAAIIAGTVTISNDTENAPAVAETTTVNYIG